MIRGQASRRRILVAASPGASDYLREIGQYARENAWHLTMDMLCTGTFPRSWRGDGVLALVAYQPEILLCIQETGIPSVAITLNDEPAHLPRVEVDNAEIGRIAADHFVERGYRNFAWAPFANDKINGDRFLSFQACLQQQGCTCRCLPPRHTRIGPYWQHDWVERRRDLVAHLQRLPRPTAIFAFNDCVAAEIIDACADAGAAVPEEVAVLGVGNDLAICESVRVPLSSVDLDLKALVHGAATALELMMDHADPGCPLLRTSPAGVVARVSTDVLAVAHPRVASALRYIAENYPNPMLSVTDVADAVSMSRRHLERCFREEIGSTINEQITRARMQEASRLLRAHPRAKSSDVAELVGIRGSGTFHRTFRRVFGMSPSANRRVSGELRKAETSPSDTAQLPASAQAWARRATSQGVKRSCPRGTDSPVGSTAVAFSSVSANTPDRRVRDDQPALYSTDQPS